MREFLIEKKLERIISKLSKKDPVTYEALLKKINEILMVEDVNHYKNLRKPLHSFKRVHINNSFVLIFKHDQQKDEILFYDFDHHDSIYLK